MDGFLLENYSKPPVRASKTHSANLRAAKYLKATFATRRLTDITADNVELYLRERLRQPARFKTSLGYRERGRLKPSTVHQELRVLRRILNVAVRKRLLPSNPCLGVEFPVAIKGLFRPHYVTWSEQQCIEAKAPWALSSQRSPHHHGNGTPGLQGIALHEKGTSEPTPKCVIWIPDSKTPNGVGELPLTKLALHAFRDQIALAGNGEYLFPSELSKTGHQYSLRTAWRLTLKRAKVPYFRIYDLRSTYATRLSSGGSRMSGSHKCFVRVTLRSSKNIRK